MYDILSNPGLGNVVELKLSYYNNVYVSLLTWLFFFLNEVSHSKTNSVIQSKRVTQMKRLKGLWNNNSTSKQCPRRFTSVSQQQSLIPLSRVNCMNSRMLLRSILHQVFCKTHIGINKLKKWNHGFIGQLWLFSLNPIFSIGIQPELALWEAWSNPHRDWQPNVAWFYIQG